MQQADKWLSLNAGMVCWRKPLSSRCFVMLKFLWSSSLLRENFMNSPAPSTFSYKSSTEREIERDRKFTLSLGLYMDLLICLLFVELHLFKRLLREDVNEFLGFYHVKAITKVKSSTPSCFNCLRCLSLSICHI